MIGDPSELLMFLETTSTKLLRKIEGGGWGWRKGVELFIAPDSRCCFCNEVFETNRIYLIDNINQTVPKQWRLASGESVRKGNKIYHPHAFQKNGEVCLNKAQTISQLLFNSINPKPDYNAPQYFWDVGHTCPDFANNTCPHCNRKAPYFALNKAYANKFLCSTGCVKDAMKTRCSVCFDNPLEDKNYCKTCLEMEQRE